MKTTIALLLSLFTVFFAVAQECKVAPPDLQGTYEGGCKDGKADGFGMATGKHKFQGMFKKGKPDGRGTYTWEDGHFYVGEWKDGLKDGEGEMHYADTTGADSVVTGTWKKDKFQPANDKGYIIHFQTQKITRITVTASEANENSIIIEVQSTSGGTGAIMSGATSAILAVSDIQLLKGQFEQLVQTTNSGTRSITRVMRPTFPFRGKLIIGSEQVDIEFTEKKNWRIQVFVNQ